MAMKGMNRKDKRVPSWNKKNVETDKPVCGAVHLNVKDKEKM